MPAAAAERRYFGHPCPAQNLAGARREYRRTPSDMHQSVYKPGFGWHAESVRMRDGHSSWTPVTRRLQQPTRTAGLDIDLSRVGLSRDQTRAVPIRSCSRWGLPCRRRCRQRGALLPHLFTLTAEYATRRGGLFSVALSLSSRPPDVIRHRLSKEPGLSSPAPPPRPSRVRGRKGGGRSGRPTN